MNPTIVSLKLRQIQKNSLHILPSSTTTFFFLWVSQRHWRTKCRVTLVLQEWKLGQRHRRFSRCFVMLRCWRVFSVSRWLLSVLNHPNFNRHKACPWPLSCFQSFGYLQKGMPLSPGKLSSLFWGISTAKENWPCPVPWQSRRMPARFHCRWQKATTKWHFPDHTFEWEACCWKWAWFGRLCVHAISLVTWQWIWSRCNSIWVCWCGQLVVSSSSQVAGMLCGLHCHHVQECNPKWWHWMCQETHAQRDWFGFQSLLDISRQAKCDESKSDEEAIGFPLLKFLVNVSWLCNCCRWMNVWNVIAVTNDWKLTDWKNASDAKQLMVAARNAK